MRSHNRERAERNPKVLSLTILKIIPGVTCCGNVPIGKMVQGFVRGHGLSLRHWQEACISCPWEYCLRNTKRLLMASGSRKVWSVGKPTGWRLRGDNRNWDDKQSKRWAGKGQNDSKQETCFFLSETCDLQPQLFLLQQTSRCWVCIC